MAPGKMILVELPPSLSRTWILVTFKSPVIQLSNHPVADGFIGFVIEVDKLILKFLTGIGPELVHQFPDGLSEIDKLRRQLAIQVNLHVDHIIQLPQQLTAGLTQGVSLFGGEVDTEKFDLGQEREHHHQ